MWNKVKENMQSHYKVLTMKIQTSNLSKHLKRVDSICSVARWEKNMCPKKLQTAGLLENENSPPVTCKLCDTVILVLVTELHLTGRI